MTELHPSDTLRLDLVGVRAELRAARQDLQRQKRAIMRSARLTSRTVKEREVELDLLVHGDPEVIRLEDVVLELQHREDLTDARLEGALRERREYEWFVREGMVDAQNNMASAMLRRPADCRCTRMSAEMAVAIEQSTDVEDGIFVGDSKYMKQRVVG